jgi:chemotaxis protein CheX
VSIAHVTNRSMRNTSTIFSKNKLNIDITPPTILTGDKIRISNKSATIGIPLQVQDFGTINLYITAEEVL